MEDSFDGFVDEVLRPAVDRGAALLDEKNPGWRDRVSPGDLDMARGCACVLGQLYADLAQRLGRIGGYVLGQEDLGILDGADEYGFDLPFLTMYSYESLKTDDGFLGRTARETAYRALEQLWVKKIKGDD